MADVIGVVEGNRIIVRQTPFRASGPEIFGESPCKQGEFELVFKFVRPRVGSKQIDKLRRQSERMRILLKMSGDMAISKLRFGLCLLAMVLLAGQTWPRAAADFDSKDNNGGKATVTVAHQIAAHRIGTIRLGINNNGTFGTGFRSGPPPDAFTGESVPSCEYPAGSNVEYLFAGAFWIGAVVGRDTLVSVGADGWSSTREFFPDVQPFGNMVKRSITYPNSPLYDGAVSEEDFICVYTDTITDGVPADYFGRPHIPLNIEVTDVTYAWSYSYAEDFVLFDYQVKNIGTLELNEVYMGVYVDADVCWDCSNTAGYIDDLCGFVRAYPTEFGNCVFRDTVNMAWIADNDGDFSAPSSAKHVTATRIVRTPAEDMTVSFNWWISNGNASLDFGPRHKNPETWRNLGTGGIGTPEGDVNKYNFMGNQEFDYDQEFAAAIQPTDTLWLFPDQSRAGDFADGYDTRYLLSFGPFTIRPGQTLPVSLAYVGGMDLHRDAGNIDYLPDEPALYYAGLDFSDLALNSTWAAWIYDNPSVDTDVDGFAGLYHICCADSLGVFDTFYNDSGGIDSIIDYLCTDADTFFYQGDGVPDFRGAAPPPAPDFWVFPTTNTLKIRFNGLRSETAIDVFSHHVDFEGYRIYLARDERAASFGVVASYDIEDYNKLTYDPGNPEAAADGYALLDVPFTINDLRCLYGDSCGDFDFNPLAFTRSWPYVHPRFAESVFVFEAQDFNVSELGVNTPMRKIYPHQPYPSSLIPDSAQPDELTEDGYLKYFEYETVITDLLPTVAYWVNVTAFDYGSPESGLSALETSVTAGAQSAYPLPAWEEVKSGGLKAYVYPNPYRLDGDYRERGFEGRATDIVRTPDRMRVLNFANLPPKCVIRIFTVDGDLVRELVHDKDPSDPKASHEEWNLITRNTQMVVSGFYYWTVEDEQGEVQIGKLAIIM